MTWRSLLYLALSLTPVVASTRITPTVDQANDPVAGLDASTLKYEKGHGYLKSVLAALEIPLDSQVLVFSKSSMQSSHIGPENPRAIYYNDHTYVGWIPGAPLIEIMTVDPVEGAKFYTVPNEAEMAVPKFNAETSDCFPCHGGRFGGQVPSLIARSSHVAPSGYPRVFSRTVSVDATTPFKQRWGGWYVTGTHGASRHMGNELSLGTDEKNTLDTEKGANVTDLRRYFKTGAYLTPHSDIVSLLVMEQQMDVQNEISRVGIRARTLLAKSPDRADLVRLCESLVRSLMGAGEATLESPVQGTSTFAETYAASAPKDGQGRSLSELDLQTRLLKYRCSPLVYSESFKSLPAEVREVVWAEIREGLTGPSAFPHIPTEERKVILGILAETVPGFKK